MPPLATSAFSISVKTIRTDSRLAPRMAMAESVTAATNSRRWSSVRPESSSTVMFGIRDLLGLGQKSCQRQRDDGMSESLKGFHQPEPSVKERNPEQLLRQFHPR